jgi:prephenate dehydrogenase
METLVVGAGAMGRWLGEVLTGEYPDPVDLSFLDTDPDRARSAAAAVGGRAVDPESPGNFDLVCVAVPIPAANDAIAAYGDAAEHAILDVTGTMTGPIEAMAEYAPDRERASLHPLFAPENEPGNVPVAVDSGGRILDGVLTALRQRGNEVFETTAEHHDEAMETVQARTHAAVLAFGLAASPVPDGFETPISAGLAELAEQVTDGEGRVYADIQSAFDGADDVAAAAQRIADADREIFKELYEEASRGWSEPEGRDGTD